MVRLILRQIRYLFFLANLPLSSVCVCSVHGVRDLFWLPIEQYRKDGRIIRGLQRGAASFGTSTASAALELSNRLVQAIQVLSLWRTRSLFRTEAKKMNSLFFIIYELFA